MKTTKLNPNPKRKANRRFAAARGSADCYEREWVITIKADTLRGAMDAAWHCWKAWRDGHEPCGGNMPRSMGDPMTYDVKRVKQPCPPNDALCGSARQPKP